MKWNDRTLANDIKFGGVLSYRHLRIIAWICLIIAQVSVVLKLEAKLAPSTASVVDSWNLVLSIFASLPVPLFLLANLSTILQSKGNYKTLFITYGGLAAALYFLANFIVFHYGFRTMLAFNPAANWGDAARVFGELLPALGKTGFVLNIFIDMLLVVLMFFFMNYNPKTKIFQGKGIIIFRSLILLPIAYEIVGIILKCNIGMETLSVPSPVFFLLPSKPPLIFAAFVVIVIGIKLGEVRYLKRNGHTREDYEEHIQTKAHGLKISVIISIIFVIFAILDLALTLGLTVFTVADVSNTYPGIDAEALQTLVLNRLNIFDNIGFGGAISLIIAVPIVLLFSYTKKHENPLIDTLIPVAGIALIAVVILEGCFQVITLNLGAFIEKLAKSLNELTAEEEPGTQGASLLLSAVKHLHL